MTKLLYDTYDRKGSKYMKCELKYLAHGIKSSAREAGVWASLAIILVSALIVTVLKYIHPFLLLIYDIAVIGFLIYFYHVAQQKCKKMKEQQETSTSAGESID